MATASPPRALISATVAAALSLEPSDTKLTITFCPALPKSRAIDLPNPRDDPVTKHTLASSATMLRVADVDVDADADDNDLWVFVKTGV
jgi:hypothetical protein